jgi:hypothetical protein
MRMLKAPRCRAVMAAGPRRAGSSPIASGGCEDVILFPVLFTQWEAKQQAADDAWRAVWCKAERINGRHRSGPTTEDIRKALVLRWQAIELLKALQAHLHARRARVSTI